MRCCLARFKETLIPLAGALLTPPRGPASKMCGICTKTLAEWSYRLWWGQLVTMDVDFTLWPRRPGPGRPTGGACS